MDIVVFSCRYTTVGHPSSCQAPVSSCDCELWPVILTSEFDLDSVKVNQHAKHPGQRSLNSNIIVRTHRHRDRLLYLDY